MTATSHFIEQVTATLTQNEILALSCILLGQVNPEFGIACYPLLAEVTAPFNTTVAGTSNFTEDEKIDIVRELLRACYLRSNS